MPRRKPIAIDLFCGVGGMSLGFKEAGFRVVGAFDNDERHINAYKNNFPSVPAFTLDLRRATGGVLLNLIHCKREIDVLFGGPPCQGFSMIGKRRKNDCRNLLLYEFSRLIREIGPSYFVLENVPGLLIGSMKGFLESFLRRVRRPGYSYVDPIQIINAVDFGVPQDRRRVVVLGYRRDLAPPRYPTPGISDSSRPGYHRPSVWDAIGDLADLEGCDYLTIEDRYRGKLGSGADYARMLRGEGSMCGSLLKASRSKHEGLSGCQRVKHSAQTVNRFRKTIPGTTEPVSRFYRLDKRGLSPTLRAGSDHSRGLFTAARPIHPVMPRCITTREAARLHSFPDWFEFDPAKCHSFRQIGNSVPPLMARRIAEAIKEVMS